MKLSLSADRNWTMNSGKKRREARRVPNMRWGSSEFGVVRCGRAAPR
jgi:hypothetical protein